MYEQSMGDFTFRDSASGQVQLFYVSLKYKLREFDERPASSISYIFPLTAILRLSSLS